MMAVVEILDLNVFISNVVTADKLLMLNTCFSIGSVLQIMLTELMVFLHGEFDLILFWCLRLKSLVLSPSEM